MWPFETRRLKTELAAVKADRERIRSERDQFARDRDTQKSATKIAARQFAQADTANRRLAARNLELGRRLSALTESDPEYAAGLERRLQRALKACRRYRAGLAEQTRRGDQLQAQWDDLLGLNRPEVAAGETWQERREPKMRWDK